MSSWGLIVGSALVVFIGAFIACLVILIRNWFDGWLLAGTIVFGAAVLGCYLGMNRANEIDEKNEQDKYVNINV
jgi:hypothetical protein